MGIDFRISYFKENTTLIVYKLSEHGLTLKDTSTVASMGYHCYQREFELQLDSPLPKVLLDKVALLDLTDEYVKGVGYRFTQMPLYHLDVTRGEAEVVFKELGKLDYL